MSVNIILHTFRTDSNIPWIRLEILIKSNLKNNIQTNI